MADHAAVTVEEDGIRVEKSFSRDEFPVPAVTFRLVSNRADPTRVRIVDTIPESFPMNQVGFHPDYESEHWTAYEDHRVEYERVLEPDEDVLTVFGIRDEAPDVDAFLTPPLVEHVPEGEEIEDILGGDNAEPVREVLAGDSDSLPGMDEPIVDSEVAAGAGEPGESVVDDEPDETVVEGPSDDAVAAAIGDVDDADDPSSENDPLSPDDGLGTTGGESDEGDVDVETGSIDLSGPAEEGEATEEPAEATAEATDEPAEATAEATSEPSSPEAEAADDLGVADESVSADESPEPRTPATDSTSAVSVHEDDTAADAAPEPAPAAASTESAVESADDESAVESADDESAVESADDESPVEPVDADSAGDSGEQEGDEPDTESASATPSAGGVESVAAALADEIRAGEVDDDDLEVLQSELDLETPESVDVRIGRLQSRVENLSAYTEALEEFIDEEGTAEQVLDKVQAELEEVRGTVAEIDEELDAAADERASLAEDVSTNDAAISEVDEAVASVETSVDRVQRSVDDLTEELAETSDELTETADQVAAVEGRVDSFDEELGDVWEDVAELDARLADVEETAAEVDSLQSEIERIDDELADLREFRESLSDAFGA